MSIEHAQKLTNASVANARFERAELPQEVGHVPLTVEELIQMCEKQLRSLDAQLRTKLGDQQKRTRTLQALGTVSQELSSLGPCPDAAKDPTAAAMWAEDASDKLDEIAKNRPELQATVDAAKEALKKGGPQAAKQANDIVNQEMDNLRGENETEMISIQSIVSKRAQSLQMTSNMVNSLNESSKSVIQNIR